VARAGVVAPQVALDRLADVEQALRVELGVDGDGGVEEVALVADEPLRLGLVDRRGGGDRDAAALERVARRAQVREPVPYVRAEPEVALYGRSFQTSTDTSETGSGIGGSGFAALTVTVSAP
jgi:hypothetical protein